MIRVRYVAPTILTIGVLALMPGCASHQETAAPAPMPAAAPAPAPTPPPAAQTQGGPEVPLSPRQIRRIQFGLKRVGLYTGRDDGVMGPETQAAISKFQEQNGLPATGVVDSATLDTMKRVAGIGLSGGGRGVRGVPVAPSAPTQQ